jgi:two-component system phosphate regulon sensor histidine kinase PhoR
VYYSFSWLKIVSNVITYLAIFGLLGWFLNALVPALAAGLLSLLAWNYWQLNKLNNWLWNSKKISPPTAVGIWEHVYEGIYHLSRRNRKKRKELGILVKRFRDGSEALPDAAVVVDDQANIVWCNRLARIELGLRWPDDAGRRIDNFIRNPKFIEYFYAGQYHFPIEVASPSNPHKMFEYRIMQYGEEHLLIIVRDVSRLSQLESMRRDFVANVSHELRTPLTVINGYLEMLPEQFQADPLAQKALQEMSSQTRRMHNLIEDLLVLSRLN